MNPFVFIVGCPRSGTTLLQRMVDAHPRIAILQRETHWIPRLFARGAGLNPDRLVTPRLIPILLADRRFADLGIAGAELERWLAADGALSYSAFVSRIFDAYGQARGKRLVGDKTPGYAREIPPLHALWPEARFVHLVRDGRDVCLSATSWRKAGKLASRFPTWSLDPVSAAAAWWEWHVRLAREAARSLEPRLYHEIRYESLVARPAGECDALCAFLGIPYDGGMLRFHEGRTRCDAERDAKHAWLPPTPGLRDWRSQMPPQDVERFEAISGDLLEELGYARAVSDPPRGAVEHASRIRESFARDARAHGRRLPEHWLDPAVASGGVAAAAAAAVTGAAAAGVASAEARAVVRT